jgi:hypothetical protein
VAVYVGTRWLGLDRQTAALIGAGSAICGAAAVMATQPVVRGEEHKVSIAVATVVVFGTLSMVLYPLVFPYLGLSEHAFGLYRGLDHPRGGAGGGRGRCGRPRRGECGGGREDAARDDAGAVPDVAVVSHGGIRERRAAGSDRNGCRNGATKGAASFSECCRQVRVPWFAVLFIA